MRSAERPTKLLSGWSVPTNNETPDCPRSRPIRYSNSDTTRDIPNLFRKCTCRPKGQAGPFAKSCGKSKCHGVKPCLGVEEMAAEQKYLGRGVDLVASLLVKSGFCCIRFWYAVAPGSRALDATSVAPVV
jgi:hypothetical protein